MKIKVLDAVNIFSFLSGLNFSDLGSSADKVTDIFIALLDIARERDRYLEQYTTDAKALAPKLAVDKEGKLTVASEKKLQNLSSFKAFEKFNTSTKDIDIPLLTIAEIKEIASGVKDFKVGQYLLLEPITQK